MPKEKESFRDNIELISEQFPGRLQITQTEAASVLGINRRYISKYVKINSFGKVGIADLARAISG